MTVVHPEPMGSELAISAGQSRFSPAQRVALAHMGADKAPDADVDVFFHVCQRTRLDPFARQIYLIGRDESVLIDGDWRKVKKFTIQTAIDGFRLVARRVADETGQELEYGDMLWCGRDGVWRDVWTGDPGELHAAKATVIRAGKSFTHVALMREYAQTKKNGEPTNMWATKGANQLAKCAEAGALRKAYPQDLGGVYVDAEMEQAANRAAADQVVEGGRDWAADVDAAQSLDELRLVWSGAHRAHALDAELKARIDAAKARLASPEPEIVDAVTVDPATGEVLDEAPPATQPTPRLTKAQATAIKREFARLGADDVKAWAPLVGVPDPNALTPEGADALIATLSAMTRDDLSALVADRAAEGAGS